LFEEKNKQLKHALTAIFFWHSKTAVCSFLENTHRHTSAAAAAILRFLWVVMDIVVLPTNDS
jgi:hypothetical protein